MDLDSSLLKDFAKLVNGSSSEDTNTATSNIVYGTIVFSGDNKFIKIDGSNELTPISATSFVSAGDRVMVQIRNHTATVTGNLTDPSASGNAVDGINKKISEFDIILANKVNAKELEAEKARIDNLVADNVTINYKLTAAEGEITNLKAEDVVISGKLSAAEANISSLQTTKLDAETADIKFATIEKLNATDAEINILKGDYGEFKNLTAADLAAVNANIQTLNTEKLSAKDADLKYANIDFSNIGEAAVTKIFSESGIIEDLVVSEGKITGELVGVTIKGDLIEGNTIKADKLVVKGSDGLYYKLNFESGNFADGEVVPDDGLHGSIIVANSITAEKIQVDDLVAFGATIGGFKIGKNSIYSGVKESVNNTTRGIYLDNSGQVAFGDSNNYIKFFKDTDGEYKLSISADTMIFSSSSKTVEETINDVKKDVDTLRDEITTLLRIESSRGTVFKNDTVATVLSVVIYHGTQRITDSTTMKQVFGNSAYLQWKWQRLDDNSFGVIVSSDPRFGDNGFTFTLSPQDVDTKVTFMCELIT